MSELDYTHSEFIIKLLKSHDAEICPIRKQFIDEETRYFKNHVRGGGVLVAGSGLGLEAKTLSNFNSYVLGIDNNPLLVSLSQAYISEPNVRFMLGDFTGLPIPDLEFDHAVLNYGTIGNFGSQDQKRIIKELTRVARITHIDFYTLQGGLRLEMYRQEGWSGVQETRGAVITADGGYSQTFQDSEFIDLVKLASEKSGIELHPLDVSGIQFGYMAKIYT